MHSAETMTAAERLAQRLELCAEAGTGDEWAEYRLRVDDASPTEAVPTPEDDGWDDLEHPVSPFEAVEWWASPVETYAEARTRHGRWMPTALVIVLTVGGPYVIARCPSEDEAVWYVEERWQDGTHSRAVTGPLPDLTDEVAHALDVADIE